MADAMLLARDLRLDPERLSRVAFLGASALFFAASTAVTVVWCISMAAMGEVPMPGGWLLSMMWMPMCDQTWFSAAISFLGMWIVMMTAMMLPSLTPMLWRYRAAISRTGDARLGRLTLLAGAGYVFVWALIGMAVFPLGAALAEAEMQVPVLAQAVPLVAGLVVLLAGALQFTAWKARHLACCRKAPTPDLMLQTGMGAAWRHGLRLGLHCSTSSAGLTVILLVMGMIDLRVMAVVTAAITAERLAPNGAQIARLTGMIAIGAGLLLIGRAAGL